MDDEDLMPIEEIREKLAYGEILFICFKNGIGRTVLVCCAGAFNAAPDQRCPRKGTVPARATPDVRNPGDAY